MEYLCCPSEASRRFCVIPGDYPPQDWQSLPCAGEELDSEEPHGVPDEDAAGHHQWGGQTHKVLARGEEHPMDPFEGQNRINEEKV